MVLPCWRFQTMAPRQTPAQVSRSMVKVCSQTSMCDCLQRGASTARMISLPVASPRAWAMRSRPWPPSRPRARWSAGLIELGAPGDQLGDALRGLADHTLDHFASHSEPPACKRVGDVVFAAVRRDPARRRCRPGRGRCWIRRIVLGDHQDRQPRIDGQGRPQSGQAAADDQHVGEEVRHLLGMEGNEVAGREHGKEEGLRRKD